MARHPLKTRAYKDSTAQQLRSFCETARLGSIAAAAAHLGLANPTVWHQVRALEREFGEPLFISHGRGSRLTKAGKLLAELTSPLVAGLATLKQRYQEARSREMTRLTVATTPRILLEHLPECVLEFRSQYSDAPLTLKEMFDDQVHAQVEAGEADLGLVMGRSGDLLDPSAVSPWLEFEPLYELDVVLIAPKDHPLARQRRIQPRDLTGYPLVNMPRTLIPDPEVFALLEKARVSQSQRQLVEAFFTSSVCRYVELGFGIGLVVLVPGHQPAATLHERVMSRYFGRPTVYQVTRKGALVGQASIAFTAIIKARLNGPPAK
jgi:DNA-binding transcriptional LysR family regulator